MEKLFSCSFWPSILQIWNSWCLPSSRYLPLSNHSFWKTHSCCKFSSVLSMEGVMTGYYLSTKTKPPIAVVSACFAILSKCSWSVEEWTHTQNISPFHAMLEVVEKSRIIFKPHYIEEPMILIRANSTFFHQNMMTLGHSFLKNPLYKLQSPLFFWCQMVKILHKGNLGPKWGTKIAKIE